jgi:hypothetical protein
VHIIFDMPATICRIVLSLLSRRTTGYRFVTGRCHSSIRGICGPSSSRLPTHNTNTRIYWILAIETQHVHQTINQSSDRPHDRLEVYIYRQLIAALGLFWPLISLTGLGAGFLGCCRSVDEAEVAVWRETARMWTTHWLVELVFR